MRAIHTARLIKSHISTATHCNTPQHTEPHCNTLQHTATQIYAPNTYDTTHQVTHIHCNTLYYTATHGDTLQRTAAPCNTHLGAQYQRGIEGKSISYKMLGTIISEAPSINIYIHLYICIIYIHLYICIYIIHAYRVFSKRYLPTSSTQRPAYIHTYTHTYLGALYQRGIEGENIFQKILANLISAAPSMHTYIHTHISRRAIPERDRGREYFPEDTCQPHQCSAQYQ